MGEWDSNGSGGKNAGGNEWIEQQKEEQRGTSGEEISSCSIQTGIDGREKASHTGAEPVCYGRKGLDGLTVSYGCCPVRGEKGTVSVITGKGSKLNRMYRAAIWALMRVQGALLPLG